MSRPQPRSRRNQASRRPRPAPRHVEGPFKHGRIAVIGVVGGIGAGKSRAAAALEKLGGFVIDADQVGHALLSQRPTRDAVLKRFGDEICDPDTPPGTPRQIDRGRLGAIVFASEPDLRALEAILHPRMRQTFERAIDRVQRRGKHPAVVLDAAVLYEAGWDDLCDHVLFIDTPRSQRLARVRETRGWSEADLNAREALQWPLDRKRDRADVRITNEATPEVLDTAVARFWNARIRPQAAAPAAGNSRPPVPAGPEHED